ncbi:MAG TPA: glycosyltransferase family 4 protein [Candidatus Bathyarchaeia archaeon]
MQIAFISPGRPAFSNYETGDVLGIETQIWGIARELAARGHDVEIVRRSSRPDFRHDSNGVTIEDLRTPDLPWEALEMYAFSRICANHVQKVPNMIAILSERLTSVAFRRLQNPKVFALHLSDGLLRETPEDSIRGLVTRCPKRLVERIAVRASDVVVTLTGTAKAALARQGFDSVVIPNAVDPADLLPGPSSGFFLFGGRLVRSKGVSVLLRAAKLIARRHPEVRVVISGSGPEESQLKALTKGLGLATAVQFQPFANRRRYLRLLGTCGAFVLPSVQEAFPVALIEAMGSGKPVIAADVPGPREIIADGHDGFVVRPWDVDGLANAMELLIRNPDLGQMLGEHGRAKVMATYTFSKVGAVYERLCGNLVTHQPLLE